MSGEGEAVPGSPLAKRLRDRTREGLVSCLLQSSWSILVPPLQN